MTAQSNGKPPEVPAPRPMTKRVRPDVGLPPAGQVAPHGGIARTEFFSRLKAPMNNGTGKKP